MTGTRAVTRHPTYQVQVAGRLGPVLRSEFADLCATTTSVVTVFRLRLDPDQGPAEIAARLHHKGLVLLRARASKDHRDESAGEPFRA
ncbi:hypothetical protein [Pengzhenrongella phosphoraccumulans]|uniref:hypothetical protein n=1 Tax=Pengzhenrongella phosphoraccumulans TaxID=3114394 RepID=UPI00388FEE63